MPRWRRGLVAVTVLATLAVGAAAAAVEGMLLPQGRGEVTTLLLLGGDQGPPRGGDVRSGRADGIQLLFVADDRQHATFVSVPRDTLTSVPGRGQTRLGHCLPSGPQTCVRAVEQEFDVEVDGYLLTSMEAFKQAVAAFGGLTVDVPTPMADGGASIPDAGEQRLSGSQALTYARDRNNRGGDVPRTRAQAELLAIGHRDVVETGDVRAALDALTIVRRHTYTDLSGAELTRLALQAMRLPPGNVQRTLASGSGDRVGGRSVYRTNERGRDRIADAARNGRLDDE